MDENKGFYFFASYMEAADLLEPEDYKAFISALLHYAIDDDPTRAEALEGTPAAFFMLIKPTLDKSKVRAAAGRKGGSVKQTVSKTEAKAKQTSSKSEAIKDKGQGIKDIYSLPEVENMDCSELEAAEPADPETAEQEKTAEQEPEYRMMLVDHSFYDVTAEQVAEYALAYPAVDVRQELREMELWCKDPANKKRKTAAGIGRFIRSWLGREQDRGRASPAAMPAFLPKSPGSFRRFEQRPFDAEQLDDLLEADSECWELERAQA